MEIINWLLEHIHSTSEAIANCIFTANKRLRSNDAYTPGGEAGFRPDYASVVYSNILKQLYPDVPVIIGGIEASLRRVTHYDYWSDSLKPSILVDSKADIGVYGMGELTMVEIAKAIQSGKKVSELTDIKQTFFLQDKKQPLPAFEGAHPIGSPWRSHPQSRRWR